MKISFSNHSGKIEFYIADRVLKNENMTNRYYQLIENILKLVTTNLVTEDCDQLAKCFHQTTLAHKTTTTEHECNPEPEPKFKTIKSLRSETAKQIVNDYLSDDYNDLAEYVNDAMSSLENQSVVDLSKCDLKTHLTMITSIITKAVFDNENLAADKDRSIIEDLTTEFANKAIFNLYKTPWKEQSTGTLYPGDIVHAVYWAVKEMVADFMTYIDTRHHYKVLCKNLLNKHDTKFGRRINDINIMALVNLVDTICFTVINAILMIVFRMELVANTKENTPKFRRIKCVQLKKMTLSYYDLHKFVQAITNDDSTKTWTEALMS